jgi:hypothetical protein
MNENKIGKIIVNCAIQLHQAGSSGNRPFPSTIHGEDPRVIRQWFGS